jgi:hypothetical protein
MSNTVIRWTCRLLAVGLLVVIAFAPAIAEQARSQGRSGGTRVDLAYRAPVFEVKYAFLDPDGNNVLDAEEAAQIEVTVTNNGGPASAVVVTIAPVQANANLTISAAQTIAGLNSGESKKLVFDVRAAFDLATGKVVLRIGVRDGDSNQARPIDLEIATAAFRAPKLVVTDWGIDDSGQTQQSFGNGNGRAERGETIQVTAVVQNQGQGAARNVTARIGVPTGIFFSGEQTLNLGDLPSGESRKVTFFFTIRPDYSGPDKLAFTLDLTEARNRYGSRMAINLTIGEQTHLAGQINEPEHVVVEGRQGGPAVIGEAPTVRIDVDEDIPRTQIENPDAFAVVIGNSVYQNASIPRVDFALRDAQVMCNYLINVMGFKPGNIKFLQNATKGQFETVFGSENNAHGWLFNQVKPQKSDVFVYYSGHGAPDTNTNQAYFVPADADPSAIAINGYSLSTFYRNLGQVPARNMTVVIDACFSGGTNDNRMLIASASPIIVEANMPVSGNISALTSTGPGQIASWYPQMHHGLFTYFFLKGLRGAADRNGDRVITVGEMQQYLADNAEGVPYFARSMFNREQQPRMQGDPNRVLVRLAQ